MELKTWKKFNGFKIDDEDDDPVQNETDKRKGDGLVDAPTYVIQLIY